MTPPCTFSPASFRRYLAVLLAGVAVWMAVVIGLNCAADAFADFYFLTGARPPRIATLDDFTDIRFKVRLVQDAGRDGVGAAAFGSSRVMRIDPAGEAFRSISPRALNLAVQGASLPQTLQFVDFVLRRNPQCIPIIGIDLFAFDTRRNGTSIYLDETKRFPAISDALSRLASRDTVPTSWQMLMGKKVSNRLESNGLAVKPPPDPKQLRSDLEAFAATGWKTWPTFRDFHYDPSKIELLTALRARCPQVVYFVNPVSRWYRKGQANAGLQPAHVAWINDLAKVGRVIDFSDDATIIDESTFYLDPHHCNSAAGELVMQDVANFLHQQPLHHGRLLAP